MSSFEKKKLTSTLHKHFMGKKVEYHEADGVFRTL